MRPLEALQTFLMPTVSGDVCAQFLTPCASSFKKIEPSFKWKEKTKQNKNQ